MIVIMMKMMLLDCDFGFQAMRLTFCLYYLFILEIFMFMFIAISFMFMFISLSFNIKE